MGVVIEICSKYPGGPTRMTVTDILRLVACGTGTLCGSCMYRCAFERY
jgi:hypothetical protein